MSNKLTPVKYGVEVDALLAAMDALGKAFFDHEVVEEQPIRNARVGALTLHYMEEAKKAYVNAGVDPITERLIL